MTKRINPYKRFLAAHVPNWLLERTEISAGAKLCYARLMQHAGKDNECWPAERSLAVELGTNLRQIQRYVAELKKSELIETEDRGIGHSQEYYFWEHEWMSAYADRSGGSKTTDPAAIRESVKESSKDSSEEESSSSSEEEDEFLNRVTSFYSSSLPASPHFLSSVPAPSRYFQTVRENGGLPVSDLDACWELAEGIYEAVNIGYLDQKILTFPTPGSLVGLTKAAPVLVKHAPQPQHLRLALYQFCLYDGGPEELSPGDILERIAKRPDLFAEALTQLSLQLG